MSKLLKTQQRLPLMIAKLIVWGEKHGYKFTFGDCARMDRHGHMENSLHYSRLAVDLNVFYDGKYLRRSEELRPLGKYWESIGGAWLNNDGNHFSIEWNGRK